MRAGRIDSAQCESHVSGRNVLDATFASASYTSRDVDEQPQECVPSLTALHGRLDAMESKLDLLLEHVATNAHVKEWYTPAEFGAIVGKTRYTVSEWCRLERINAEKAESGRGRNREWRISHEELERYERESLLPVKYPGM